MIRKVEGSEIQIIELGHKTTFISQIMAKDENVSSGIVFSNHNDDKLHGDEIIIEISNTNGVASYIKAILKYLETWGIEETEKPIADLLNTLELFEKKEDEHE